MKELVLMASDETLYTVLDEVRGILEQNDCPSDLITSISIAVEEIYVNIAHYAYGGKAGEAVIDIDVIPDPKKIVIVFKDKGIPYDPLQKEDPDIDLSAEERQIGGLGVFMVKNIMDEVSYEYKDEHNVFTMAKAI